MRSSPFALLPLLLVACTDVQSPEIEQQPQFNFSNGPADPGNSVVGRNSFPTPFIGTDPVRDLVSVNGLGTLDPSQSWVCGGAEDFDIVEAQLVVSKQASDDVSLRTLWVIENPTQHIYAGIDNFFSLLLQNGFCDAVSLPRLAEGIGAEFRLTGNCLFNVCDQTAATGGVTAHGTLDDLVNGGKTNYSEEQRFVDNFDTGERRSLVENIRLTHIGKP